MIYMNNMAVCNYIVGVLGAVIGGLIMQAAAAFPLEFTENGPVRASGLLRWVRCWALFRFCCCFIPLSIKLIYMA